MLRNWEQENPQTVWLFAPLRLACLPPSLPFNSYYNYNGHSRTSSLLIADHYLRTSNRRAGRQYRHGRQSSLADVIELFMRRGKKGGRRTEAERGRTAEEALARWTRTLRTSVRRPVAGGGDDEGGGVMAYKYHSGVGEECNVAKGRRFLFRSLSLSLSLGLLS